MLWVDQNAKDRAVGPDQPEHDAPYMRWPAKPAPAHELQFHELINILYRRSRMIVTIAVVGTMLAGVVGLVVSPKYTATVEVAVEPQEAVPGKRSFSPTEESPIDTQVTLLTSRDHLDRVLTNLTADPEFRAMMPGDDIAAGANGTDLSGDPASRPAATEKPADPMITDDVGSLSLGELVRRLKIWIGALGGRGGRSVLSAEQLERGLKVMQERRSRIITVSFTSKSPRQAAFVANRIVQLYVDSQNEQRRTNTSFELAKLDQRIAELKNDVDSAAAAMQKLTQQRIAGGQAGGSEGQGADVRLRELERETVVGRQLYADLLRRQKEVRGQQELVVPDVSIVSLAAPPDRPSSPNPILFILPAFIVFSICGSLLAVVLHRLDRRLRSERDVIDALGIPCIGLVPQLPRACTTRPYQYLKTQPFSAYAEAIRSVAATLQLPHTRVSKVVLISSSIPNEGKTTLAVSLAGYVAALGRRVLLVDLDFRQGSMLGNFDGKVEKAVLDLYLQNRPPAEFIQHIPDLAIDYLPMPRCRLDPLALLAGEQMPLLLRQLREGYDCVIIDGQPLLGITEARLLPAMVDKLLLVVKWGSTRREVAQNAINLLWESGCFDKEAHDLPAAVVTQVDLKQHARYRFGDVAELLVKYREYYSRSSEVQR